MRADSRSLSVSLTFASPREATLFFLRPLVGRGSLAAKAALAMVDRGEAPNWEEANEEAFAAHVATTPEGADFWPRPGLFTAYRGQGWDAGVCFGGGRSMLLLRGREVVIGDWRVTPIPLAPEEVADAIAGRLLGGLAPWQQTPERGALVRKLLALWAKDRAEREAAAEEERLARRSGLTVAAYRERLAKAARRSGRAGSGGKKHWTARRSA